MCEQQEIEAGDVFRWFTDDKECVSVEDDLVFDGKSYWSKANCALVRKAAKEPKFPPIPVGTKDPYAGLTLPEPPKGYRMAKWGEEHDAAVYWNDTQWKAWGHLGKHAYSLAESSIFAVPIESTLPKTWQFCEEPWTAPEPKTLADCPEEVDVVCTFWTDSELLLMRRVGHAAHGTTGKAAACYCGSAKDFCFLRYLDPQPPPPPTLEQVPDGRVFQASEGDAVWYWKHSYKGLHRILVGPDPLNGEIRETTFSGIPVITNFVAELK